MICSICLCLSFLHISVNILRQVNLFLIDFFLKVAVLREAKAISYAGESNFALFISCLKVTM